jgi:hypothetical protein
MNKLIIYSSKQISWWVYNAPNNTWAQQEIFKVIEKNSVVGLVLNDTMIKVYYYPFQGHMGILKAEFPKAITNIIYYYE